MTLNDQWKAILKIQKFRRVVSYTGFYCFVSALTYVYTNNTTRAGMSRADQFYASYPAGIELLTDTAKLYKSALANCFEEEDWGPIEFSIMAKHFERQGKPPYAYHSWVVDINSRPVEPQYKGILLVHITPSKPSGFVEGGWNPMY